MTERIVIMGAAGRDFHDFNVAFRGRDDVRVVAFTRAPGQNLGEADGEGLRRYPAALAGDEYPDGIPIVPEVELAAVVRGDHEAGGEAGGEAGADRVVFSYSDVSHEHVMHAGSRAMAAGADFGVIGPDRMQLAADVPVVAVNAVRTGCGKSALARDLADALGDRGCDVAVIREPMPYGDLAEKRVQRFATMDDIDDADLTLEEREEFEWHVEAGHAVYAGVDYADVLAAATENADIVVWDGGNNELAFVEPDVHLVIADPTRPGHEHRYHPGETNLRRADAVRLTKVDAADPDDVAAVRERVHELSPPETPVHRAAAVVTVPDPEVVAGNRVLALEDGPTVTHGGADHGAATVAAHRYGASERVDPRPHAVGSVAETLAEHDHLDRVLPAMGYTDEQVAELEATITACDPDLVLAGTPCDVSRVLDVDVPVVDVQYRFEPLDWSVEAFLDDHAGTLGLD
ncbi:cyclic 2,3-diphosphoglycerate synthase [Halorubrum gandharaense]